MGPIPTWITCVKDAFRAWVSLEDIPLFRRPLAQNLTDASKYEKHKETSSPVFSIDERDGKRWHKDAATKNRSLNVNVQLIRMTHIKYVQSNISSCSSIDESDNIKLEDQLSCNAHLRPKPEQVYFPSFLFGSLFDHTKICTSIFPFIPQ